MNRHTMIKLSRVALLACLVFPLVACDFVTQLLNVPANIEATATYRLDFVSTWSAATHPTDIPSNPHFSPLIGATHNDGAEFWSAGVIATSGIQQMAERGQKPALRDEMMAEITAGNAERVIEGPDNFDSPGSVIVTFEISSTFPLVTAVSMIAPSPDWFVGVHDVSLLTSTGWVDELVIQLMPYDAGTDSGTTYRSSDSATDPAELIQMITGDPFITNGDVPPLGTFTFTRIDAE